MQSGIDEKRNNAPEIKINLERGKKICFCTRPILTIINPLKTGLY